MAFQGGSMIGPSNLASTTSEHDSVPAPLPKDSQPIFHVCSVRTTSNSETGGHSLHETTGLQPIEDLFQLRYPETPRTPYPRMHSGMHARANCARLCPLGRNPMANVVLSICWEMEHRASHAQKDQVGCHYTSSRQRPCPHNDDGQMEC